MKGNIRLGLILLGVFLTVLSVLANEEQSYSLKLVRTIPSEKEEEGDLYFKKIRDLEISPDGRLVVLDSELKRIAFIDLDSGTFSFLGTAGQGPGEFSDPREIGFDERGRLAVYDMGRQNIQFFDTKGAFLSGFRVFKLLKGIEYRSRKIFVNPIQKKLDDKLIEVFDESGKMLNAFGEEPKLDVNRFTDVKDNWLASHDQGGILLTWRFFSWFHVYHESGRLIRSGEIESELLRERSEKNLRTAKLITGNPLYPESISDMKGFRDEIFVLVNSRRVEIFAVTEEGKIQARYGIDKIIVNQKDGRDRYGLYEKMCARMTQNGLEFIVAMNYPETRMEWYRLEPSVKVQ